MLVHIYSYTHILIYSYTHILIYSYTHILIYSYTHILIYSYTHILIYSYTHTHILIYLPTNPKKSLIITLSILGGRNLKSKYRERSMTEAIRGNINESFNVILSASCG